QAARALQRDASAARGDAPAPVVVHPLRGDRSRAAPAPRPQDHLAGAAHLLQRLRLDARSVTAYIVRRLVGALPLLLFISIVTYAMMSLAPGGPSAVLGPKGANSPAAIARLNALYGLDKPWYLQYFYWLRELVLHGSLGTSFVDQRPVVTKVLEKLPVTIEMVGLALLLTLIIAIPIGIYAGARRGSVFDRLSSTAGFILYGAPIFWLSLLLIDAFALHLHWFPSSG